MRSQIKVCVQFFSPFILATTILSGLFFTFQPLPAAAQNLNSYGFVSSRQETLTTIAPPPLPFIQASSVLTIFLPIIVKNPQPLFWDDFSDEDSGWPTGDDGNCDSSYDGGRYRLEVNQDEICYRFAPPDNDNPSQNPERSFGTFEVSVYHSDFQSSNAFMGIYFNGAGGDEQYIFRIRPNITNCSGGGGWDLIRNREDDGSDTNEDTVKAVACDTAIVRGYGPLSINTLRAKHTGIDRRITLFINNQQVFTFIEATDLQLTGKGTGVYAKAPSDKGIIIKFDDFKVYSPTSSP
jgi:hypothetical protein